MGAILIRSEVPRDYAIVASLVRAAFGGRASEPALVEEIRASGSYRPDLALVAERDGEILGHVMLSELAIRREDSEDCRALVLAPLSVRPDVQRKGIGASLVEEGMYRADLAAEALVLVLGDPVYYRQFGFRFASDVGLLVPPPLDASKFMARLLTGCSPGHRGMVVFPSMFADTGTL